MAFIIPDKILETLVCDTCSKYLSVKPVIVYPNRRIKCGRCVRSKKQNDGIVSLYKVIAEKSLFKCVNRFDGCRELLTYTQVVDHEKTCLGKVYKCPICHDNPEIPTFLLLKHFKVDHKEVVLEQPGLFFNLNQHLETLQIYFYKSGDDLFFLQLSNSRTEELIKVNLRYIGDAKAAKSITCQYKLTSDYEEFKYRSKEEACSAYGVENTKTLCIKIPKSVQTLSLEFEIHKEPKLILLPLSVGRSGRSDDVFPEKLPFSPMFQTITLRKIFLSTNFKQDFPKVSLSKCGYAIIQQSIKYFLHCSNCQEICWRGLSKDTLVQEFYVSTKYPHSICYYCFQILKQELKIDENEYMVSNLGTKFLKDVQFCCKWKCGETFFAEHHLGHEESCTFQPLLHCPELNCHFGGTLTEIVAHMMVHPGKDICAYSNFYISCLFNRTLYMFVQNHFVLVKVLSDKAGLNISAKLCEYYNKEIVEKFKPVALLFDDNKLFLMKFQNSITKNEANHWFKIILTN